MIGNKDDKIKTFKSSDRPDKRKSEFGAGVQLS